MNYAYWVGDHLFFQLRVLSGIASKILIIGPDCVGMSFERLSFEMSEDNLSNESFA